MAKFASNLLLLTLLAFAGRTAMADASKPSWDGRISDSMCGATHMTEPDASGKKMSDGECVRSCVKDGSAYVFVSGEKVYAIGNQTFPKLPESAGREVTLFGKMSNGAIVVSRIVIRK
jgi:hypothetical protein